VRNVLAQHLNRHTVGQARVLMLNERGDLLIMDRRSAHNPRTRRRGMYVKSLTVVPVSESWKPALVKHRYLSTSKKAA
jgi:hypothetical protein